MDTDTSQEGLDSGRLDAAALAANFTDLHPPLTGHESAVAADRCYFCHDAPCVTACPTAIDIPLFIRQIASGTPDAAARTIFDQNILGGMCARVCPTEVLCEQACVRELAEGKPVLIGQLQRFATDSLMRRDDHPYTRAPETGKRIAVVGAGPAGLACAHRLALRGHAVDLYDARSKGGGLNEFGIAAYKTVDDFAQTELNWLLAIGGINVLYGKGFGHGLDLDELVASHDAVFLGIGLTGVNQLGIEGEPPAGDDGAEFLTGPNGMGAGMPSEPVENAVRFISQIRQSADRTDVAVGRRVVVIGGGMTAIDAAVQARLLGAEEVTLAYRRDASAMGASRYEQDLATSKGVRILLNAKPQKITPGENGIQVVFDRTRSENGEMTLTGETVTLDADHVLRAVGQTIQNTPQGLEMKRRKIATDPAGRTSRAGVWAGGDCTSEGDDLTVTAVAQGRDAAEDIHARLTG